MADRDLFDISLSRVELQIVRVIDTPGNHLSGYSGGGASTNERGVVWMSDALAIDSSYDADTSYASEFRDDRVAKAGRTELVISKYFTS